MTMVSKEEFLHLFDRFALLTCQPNVKQRIVDVVNHKHEVVAITTAIQEEIFLEMGIDPQFGLACLGKINMTYESDRDLMNHFYEFVAKEEMACEEAELGQDRFAERLTMQQNLQEQMLKYMCNFHMDNQSAILEKKLNKANFETRAFMLIVEQMQDVVRQRVSHLFQPR